MCDNIYMNTHAPFYDMSFDFAHKTQNLFTLYIPPKTQVTALSWTPSIVVSHGQELYGHRLNI